jgi:hypothetical protein
MIDHFEELDAEVWLPHYLPHWSSRAESAATYTVARSELRLTIPPEQGLWCPDTHEEPLRVSGVQSGVLDAPELDIDVSEHHVYAADWQPGRVDFSVDGEHVKTVHQAPAYPLQAMVAVFDFPAKGGSEHVPLLAVDYVSGGPQRHRTS